MLPQNKLFHLLEVFLAGHCPLAVVESEVDCVSKVDMEEGGGIEVYFHEGLSVLITVMDDGFIN